MTDSVTFEYPLVIKYHLTSYSWYAPGYKSTLMSVAHDTIILNGNSSITNSASYTPGATAALQLQPAAGMLNVYPNPAVNNSTLSFILERPGDAHFALVNAIGQTIRSWNESTLAAGIHSEEIELGDLESGVYFLRLDMMSRKQVIAQFSKL